MIRFYICPNCGQKNRVEIRQEKKRNICGSCWANLEPFRDFDEDRNFEPIKNINELPNDINSSYKSEFHPNHSKKIDNKKLKKQKS